MNDFNSHLRDYISIYHRPLKTFVTPGRDTTTERTCAEAESLIAHYYRANVLRRHFQGVHQVLHTFHVQTSRVFEPKQCGSARIASILNRAYVGHRWSSSPLRSQTAKSLQDDYKK